MSLSSSQAHGPNGGDTGVGVGVGVFGGRGFCGTHFATTCTSHDASTLPSFTVATMDFPSSPVVSTLIDVVPCPLVIFPALTRHKKLMRGLPASSAVKVTGSPARPEDGQLILITGTWERKTSRANSSGLS